MQMVKDVILAILGMFLLIGALASQCKASDSMVVTSGGFEYVWEYSQDNYQDLKDRFEVCWIESDEHNKDIKLLMCEL